MDYTAHYLSPIGGITLASDGKALVGLWFDGQKYFADLLDPVHEERDDLEIFAEARRWLDIYFSGKNPDSMPNIALRGSQAVGGAVGHNPLSLIVPCHRVVGADGRLTGYAGGIDKKEWLLRMEGAMPQVSK